MPPKVTQPIPQVLSHRPDGVSSGSVASVAPVVLPKPVSKITPPPQPGAFRPAAKPFPKMPVPVRQGPPLGRRIVLTPPITVRNLSEKLGIKVNELIGKLINHNIMARINDVLTEEAILLLALEYNYEIELEKPRDIVKELVGKATDEEVATDLLPRAPVVVLMGHVDHGKTSLLDKIRTTRVAQNEAGGITQHIGAHEVMINNKKVVFLDTPGHEAFTAMRARGANVTDIVILVVAADDGVMPQTEEALSHARAANVPVIVAINKIDKKEANPIKVRQQLAHLGLIPEEWGGKTIFIEVSALTGQGIAHLLEMLILQAEILELKANPKRPASGTILEARLTDDYGVLATGLVQNGTLRRGDPIVCGTTFGKVRVMLNDRGQRIDETGPTTPVLLAGLTELPEVGDKFYVVEDSAQSRIIAENEQTKRQSVTGVPAHITLETLYQHIERDKIKEVKIVLKGDVQGSVEVLAGLLVGFSTPEVRLRIIHHGVGNISESDILLADASDALIVGFQVSVDERVQTLAQAKGVEIKTYNVIYRLTEEIKLALQGMLEPEKTEKVTAYLLVKEVFSISSIGTIAGCLVNNGTIERNNLVRIKRDKKIIFEGKIGSLKRFKEDVREVPTGMECGIKVDGFDKVQPGDIIEAYRIEEKARTL